MFMYLLCPADVSPVSLCLCSECLYICDCLCVCMVCVCVCACVCNLCSCIYFALLMSVYACAVNGAFVSVCIVYVHVSTLCICTTLCVVHILCLCVCVLCESYDMCVCLCVGSHHYLLYDGSGCDWSCDHGGPLPHDHLLTGVHTSLLLRSLLVHSPPLHHLPRGTGTPPVRVSFYGGTCPST